MTQRRPIAAVISAKLDVDTPESLVVVCDDGSTWMSARR
jgi:hypothetical protein